MIPGVGQLCAEGEKAFRNDEFEQAAAWYELACRAVFVEGRDHEDLVQARFERCAELRRMTVARTVRRTISPGYGHVLGIQTCKGREVFRQKLSDSLMAAGLRWWRGPKIEVTDFSGSQAQGFFRVLRDAAKQKNFSALTLLEDDVELSRGALDYIQNVVVDDDLALISWFSTNNYTAAEHPVLDCSLTAKDYWFHQCITLPARTVHELLDSDVLKNWAEPHGADMIYGKVFPDRRVAIHYPNLAQHVGGLDSRVGNSGSGERTSPSFLTNPVFLRNS